MHLGTTTLVEAVRGERCEREPLCGTPRLNGGQVHSRVSLLANRDVSTTSTCSERRPWDSVPSKRTATSITVSPRQQMLEELEREVHRSATRSMAAPS